MGGIWECREVGRGGGKATDINSRGKLLGGGLLPRGRVITEMWGKGLKIIILRNFLKKTIFVTLKGL